MKHEVNRKEKAAIDWNEVRQKIDAAGRALKRDRELSLQETRRVLRERARALAREEAPIATGGKRIEILEFDLSYENYGIESSYVREVYPLKEFTPLPGIPPFVLGILNVRGQIVSVLDIKKLFDLPEKGLTELNKVIILRNSRMEFGILADAVLGTRSLPIDELQPTLPTLQGIRAEYLKGVTPERLVILDGEKLLADKKMIVGEEGEP